MGAFLKLAGDYSDWVVYKKSVIICDVTEMFIQRAFRFRHAPSTRCSRRHVHASRIL